MPNFVSPGVYTVENDQSDYAPSLNSSIVGLVGFASRGPTDSPTLITSPADLIRVFGTPDLVTGGQGLYAALEILQKTNQVYFVRAAVAANANESDNGIPLATHPHICIDVAGMNKDWAYRFDVKGFDLNGLQNGELVSLYAYRERTWCPAGDSRMPTTDPNSWGTVDWHNAIGAGAAQAVSPKAGPFSYIPSALGVASGLFVAKTLGASLNSCSRLEITAYAASASGELQFTGTYLSASPIDATELTFVQLLGYNTAAHNMLAGASSIEAYFPLTGTINSTNAPSGVTFAVSGGAGAYQIASMYPGLGYNYSAIAYPTGIQYRGLQTRVETNSDGTFGVNIYSDGNFEESYLMALAKPSSEVSATSLWPEDVLNTNITNAVSRHVKGNLYTFSDETVTIPGGGLATNGTGVVSGLYQFTAPSSFGGEITGRFSYLSGNGAMQNGSNATSQTWRCVSLLPGTYNLTTGTNGDASDYAGSMSNANIRTAIIGSPGSKTGLNSLDRDDIPITLAAVPGVTDQSIQNALITLAENTQNFLAVLSPPVGFNGAQQAIDWSNGKGTGRTAAINSSYAAVYWPWVKVFDAFTGKDIYLDPASLAIGQMCYTDQVSDPWFAPAGLTRGRLTKPVDVEVKLNQGDRDALYSPGNIINPITKFTSDGIVIYGQRTGQRAPTALDRINVRRLMIYLRKLVLISARRFAFEPNDPVTWQAIRNIITPALADIQQRRGITAFQVRCDSTTNSPLRIDRNELWCTVMIKPTKTAEVIVFELNLTNQSANF